VGFFDKFKISRLREGLVKTQENLVQKFTRILRGSRKIDDELMSEIEETLLLADVGFATTEQIMKSVIAEMARMRWSEASQLRDELRSEITKALTHHGEFISADDPFSVPADKKPYVIMVIGVNGVGKTTTIGKLAYNYRNAGKKVIIGAADTFRQIRSLKFGLNVPELILYSSTTVPILLLLLTIPFNRLLQKMPMLC